MVIYLNAPQRGGCVLLPVLLGYVMYLAKSVFSEKEKISSFEVRLAVESDTLSLGPRRSIPFEGSASHQHLL